MNEILNELTNYGIIPVVKIENIEDALPLGKALIDGGLPIAEITFRTKAAEAVIKILSKELPELIVGAGTVLSIDQAKKAVQAGAKFIVSPGFSDDVVKYCVDNNIPITPGICTPSDIERALKYDLSILKFFPAEASGGLSMLKAMSAPYSSIKFIPTGGIDQNNINAYLSFDKVLACGGSWMVKSNLISEKKFDEIEKLTKEAVYTMLGFEFAHLGINEENEKKANDTAKFFNTFFNFQINDGASSIFMNRDFEIMKNPYLGKHGHIAIFTNDIHRAIFYLDKIGLKEQKDTRKDKNGKLIASYVEGEVSGFAIHLLQKQFLNS